MTSRFPFAQAAFALVASFAAASAFAASAANADRAPGTPGSIPHPIEAYLPITLEKNACTTCHLPAKAGEPAQSINIPLTHYQNGKLSGERYECLVCHPASKSTGEAAPVDPNADRP